MLAVAGTDAADAVAVLWLHRALLSAWGWMDGGWNRSFCCGLALLDGGNGYNEEWLVLLTDWLWLTDCVDGINWASRLFLSLEGVKGGER